MATGKNEGPAGENPLATPIADEALDEAAGGAGAPAAQVAAEPAVPKRKTEQTRQTTLIQDL